MWKMTVDDDKVMDGKGYPWIVSVLRTSTPEGTPASPTRVPGGYQPEDLDFAHLQTNNHIIYLMKAHESTWLAVKHEEYMAVKLAAKHPAFLSCDSALFAGWGPIVS